MNVLFVVLKWVKCGVEIDVPDKLHTDDLTDNRDRAAAVPNVTERLRHRGVPGK